MRQIFINMKLIDKKMHSNETIDTLLNMHSFVIIT
jgi:hypothetical protein